jgi:hypothetical protein
MSFLRLIRLKAGQFRPDDDFLVVLGHVETPQPHGADVLVERAEATEPQAVEQGVEVALEPL